MTTDRRPDPSLSSADTGGAYVGTRGMEGEAPRPFTVDTNAEEAYWRENYASRPYTREGRSFLEYKPAYKYGATTGTASRAPRASPGTRPATRRATHGSA